MTLSEFRDQTDAEIPTSTIGAGGAWATSPLQWAHEYRAATEAWEVGVVRVAAGGRDLADVAQNPSYDAVISATISSVTRGSAYAWTVVLHPLLGSAEQAQMSNYLVHATARNWQSGDAIFSSRHRGNPALGVEKLALSRRSLHQSTTAAVARPDFLRAIWDGLSRVFWPSRSTTPGLSAADYEYVTERLRAIDEKLARSEDQSTPRPRGA